MTSSAALVGLGSILIGDAPLVKFMRLVFCSHAR